MTTTDEILRFLDEFLGLQVDGPDADLFEEAGMDSLQVNALLVFIEERFGVEVPGAQVTTDALATPAKVAALVDALK